MSDELQWSGALFEGLGAKKPEDSKQEAELHPVE